MSKVLTPKRQRFVEEYVVDLNATQAAIRAGYAERGARTEGARLLADADIQSAIAERVKIISEQTLVDAAYVIKGLKAEAEFTGEGSSHGARVTAYTQLGKHLGIFEKDNTQKRPQVVLDQTDQQL